MGSGTHSGPARPGDRTAPGRRLRAASRVAGTTIAALLAVGLTPGAADAAPRRPSDTQIADARAAADAVSARIGELSGRLTAAEDAVSGAHQAAALALDDYQATEAEYQAAQSRADVAAAAAVQATRDLGVARDQVVAFARRSFMSGSTYAGAAALITAADLGQLIERAALLEAAGAHRSDVLVEVTVLQEEAARTEAVARTALAEADDLKEQAAADLAVAQTAERSAREQAAALGTQQDQLEAELAGAQEQLRQLVGDREAADREAQRQAAALAAAARPTTPAPRPTTPAPRPTGPATNPAPPAVPPAVRPAPGPVGDPGPADPGPSSAGAAAIAAAKAYLGTPYAWGGGSRNGPGPGLAPDEGVVGFDCSSLTQYAYARAGVSIPRNSRAQYAALPKVGGDDLQAGDLVFWASDPSNWQTIYHVALYLGGGRVLQAPESGNVVKISAMWWRGYAGAVRPGA